MRGELHIKPSEIFEKKNRKKQKFTFTLFVAKDTKIQTKIQKTLNKIQKIKPFLELFNIKHILLPYGTEFPFRFELLFKRTFVADQLCK